jgi:large subunit ribosomal protein L13
MRTISAKPEEVKRGWYLVNADGRTLGRLATELARRLRGKHKPIYTPHVDTGDFIVVVNAARIKVTGRKLKDKTYERFTGHVGNLKSETLEELMARAPDRALRIAVKGMLPKNSLGAAMLKKLKIFPGAEHTHAAQQPQPLDI